MWDVIIIRGSNHYPQDIELTVENSHPSLKAHSSAAFSVEIEGEERLVVACEVERTYLRKLNTDEVVREIQIALSTEHELEVYGIVLLKTGSIPKTSSGKIQRRACQLGFLKDSLNVVGQWQKTFEKEGSSLAQTTGKVKHYQLLAELESSSPKEREKLLIIHLQSEVARVLGMTTSQIDVQQPLNTIGLDSMMAVELQHCVQTDLGMELPIVKFIEDISIVELATEVNGQMTQMASNQGVEQENNEQLLLTDVKDSNWIEVVL